MTIDLINSPPHYTGHGSGVESIEICERLPYCYASALKYLWRCDLKGSPVDDLKKAAWFLRRALEKKQFCHQPGGDAFNRALDYEISLARNCEYKFTLLGAYLLALWSSEKKFEPILERIESEIVARTS